MDRININGEEWIRLHDICDILRIVKENHVFENTDKIIDNIAQLMFYDKVRKASTKEEREAARELPGDFIVVKKIGKREFEAFERWKDKNPVIGHDIKRALYFEYKSMADGVAEKLGEGWSSVCMGIEDGRIVKRALENLRKDMNEHGYSREEDDDWEE